MDGWMDRFGVQSVRSFIVDRLCSPPAYQPQTLILSSPKFQTHPPQPLTPQPPPIISPDVLDAALLRPGRFDRRVPVERPDRLGREQILRVRLAERLGAVGGSFAAAGAVGGCLFGSCLLLVW